MNSDYSPLELRIAIADASGADSFRQVVRQSDSNTDAAIYYRSKQLKQIAGGLSLHTDDLSNTDIRAKIRAFLTSQQQAPASSDDTAVNGGEQSVSVADGGYVKTAGGGDRFSGGDLAQLADFLSVSPDTPYAEIELRRLAGSAIAGPYVAKLLEAAYIDVYLSANVGSTTAPLGSRAYYPHRLEQVHEIPDSATSHPQCHRYIVDSSYKDPTINNEDALNTANRVDAQAVILADQEGAMQQTIESVLTGLDMAEGHPFDGDIIIPLQAPHDGCYRKLRNAGVSADHIYAIGGYRSESDANKIEAAKAVQAEADDHVRLHGLGFGVTDQMACRIRSEPELLESVDVSTPAQDYIGRHANGKEANSSVAADAGAHLVERLRRVSSLVDEPGNSTLGDY